jgi:hypothetical protein
MSAKVILYGQTTKKMNFLPICVPVEASHEEPKKQNKSCSTIFSVPFQDLKGIEMVAS